MSNERKPNGLINEKSPYLKQHAYNPVDWNPWTEEVLQRAKDEIHAFEAQRVRSETGLGADGAVDH